MSMRRADFAQLLIRATKCIGGIPWTMREMTEQKVIVLRI
jgi:hypothetical protein